MDHGISVLLALVAWFALSFAVSGAPSPILQVNVLHRHGARQEGKYVNGQLNFNDAELTKAGAEMATQLGVALRLRYQSMLDIGKTPMQLQARSTDMARTIQTGYGAVSAASNSTIPFITHVPLAKDFLLAFADNFPSRILTANYWLRVSQMDDVAAALLGSAGVDTLSSLFGAWCHEHVMLCALYAEDVAQCRFSNGGLNESLWLLFPKLLQLQRMNYKWKFGVNASSPFFPAGAVGYSIANQFLENAAEAVAQWSAAGEASTKWYHYSAHDNTVVGLYAALGAVTLDSDSALWVPRFAETVVMEVYGNGTAAFFRGLPNETFNSGHSFGPFEPLPVACEAEDGTVTNSYTCGIADVLRFVRRCAPTAVEVVRGDTSAACWLPSEYAGLCNAVDSSPSPLCATYRSGCPLSCSVIVSDSVLDVASDYTCWTFVSVTFSDNAASSLLSAFGSLFVGLALGNLIKKIVVYEERSDTDVAYLDAASDDESVA